jgi:hypothetical protein
MTISLTHNVKISGLQQAQSWLKQDSDLETYRPMVNNPWPLVFIAPKRLESAFPPQRLTAGNDSARVVGEAETSSSNAHKRHRMLDGERKESEEGEKATPSVWQRKVC